jgi:hypothetical protein
MDNLLPGCAPLQPLTLLRFRGWDHREVMDGGRMESALRVSADKSSRHKIYELEVLIWPFRTVAVTIRMLFLYESSKLQMAEQTNTTNV